MIKCIIPLRGSDPMGYGHFHASRGSRLHNGLDFAAMPESQILNFECGKVTKIGQVYRDTTEFKYVQVSLVDGARMRYFYIEPSSKLWIGKMVQKDEVLGLLQDVRTKHGKSMKPHLHLEILNVDNRFVDPYHFMETRYE